MKILETGRKHWKLMTGVAGVVAVIAFFSSNGSKKSEPAANPSQVGIALPAHAAVQKVELVNRASQVPVIGTVMSEETVVLSARIPATVSKVLAITGKAVAKGELLVVLDDREIQAQFLAADAQSKQAEAEYQRTRKLMEARATTDQAMTAAEAMMKAAGAQLDRMKVMLSYAMVTSPIDGIVIERKVEAGDLATPGQALATVYDPKRMRLECPVPVRLIDKLPVGKEVRVQLDRPGKTINGRVSEIVGEVDAASRTQKVKVSLEGIAGEALPGSFGRLLVEEDSSPTLCVPVTAVYRVGQLELVQVVHDGIVIRRLVRTGAALDGQVEVIAGLNNGEQILVNPVKGD